MSETPERIEREMLEIRRRMSPDMNDLRKHIQPQVVAEQVKQTIRQRLRDAADRGKANLKAKQQDFAYSAKRQLSQVRRNISNERGE
jgi:macrodomain Ter protein organizer (MatP/YcbG family)